MCDPEFSGRKDQLTAVDQSDGRCERQKIENKCRGKHGARGQQA
jgi:hypothetical protein